MSLADTAAIEEARDDLAYLTELLDDLWRHGCASVTITFRDVPEWAYDDLEGQIVTRFPEGELKREKVNAKVLVEFVPERS